MKKELCNWCKSRRKRDNEALLSRRVRHISTLPCIVKTCLNNGEIK